MAKSYLDEYYWLPRNVTWKIRCHLLGGFAANTRSKRVLECFWRFSFYTGVLVYGVFVMYDRSWLWNVRECWINYPHHPVSKQIWLYYMWEQSFYYSLLIASVFDVRRSDFWQLVFHHIVTIGLLSFSWVINFVRVGTLVLLSHDVADVVLEFGKLVRYDRTKKTATNICFVAFLSSWMVTRLGYFPFVLLRSAILEAAHLIQPDYDVFDFSQMPFAPRLLFVMLCALLVLHVFWTILILRIVMKTLRDGEATDMRSGSEDESVVSSSKDRHRILTKKLTRKQE